MKSIRNGQKSLDGQPKDNENKADLNDFVQDGKNIVDPDTYEVFLQGLEVKPSQEIPPPRTAWRQFVGGEYRTLGTLGDFSMIIGKAKSRKSFFINIALSAVLSKDKLLDQFEGALPFDKRKVLYFDTEQSKYYVQLAIKRICDRINEPEPDDLKVYALRKLKPSDRLKAIEYLIYHTDNLGFVVIDGIKDLVTSINDEAEATMIGSKLLQWTEEREIHILNVLHQNKSDNNARGHIGTELINKAETTLSVTKDDQDKDISIVQAEYCRGKEPQPFAFEIIDGMPEIAENYEMRTESRKDKFDITDLNNIDQREILHIVFSNGKEFTYMELINQIQLAFKTKFDKKIGDNRNKKFITYCKNKG